MPADMRLGLLILSLILFVGFNMCGRAKVAPAPRAGSDFSPPAAASATASALAPKVDFSTQIRPILESRCTPCHFAGGTMYERLPFDRPETIKQLGTKLFSRIKDEKEQQLIREFLSQ